MSYKCWQLCFFQLLSETGFYRATLYASSVYAMALCPSVCLSQVAVLLKQLKAGSHKRNYTITQDCSFCMIACVEHFTGYYKTDHQLRTVAGNNVHSQRLGSACKQTQNCKNRSAQQQILSVIDTLAYTVRSRVYETVRYPSVCLSHLPRSGFAAVGPAGRRYRSIAARPAPQQRGVAARRSSKCG